MGLFFRLHFSLKRCKTLEINLRTVFRFKTKNIRDTNSGTAVLNFSSNIWPVPALRPGYFSARSPRKADRAGLSLRSLSPESFFTRTSTGFPIHQPIVTSSSLVSAPLSKAGRDMRLSVPGQQSRRPSHRMWLEPQRRPSEQW